MEIAIRQHPKATIVAVAGRMDALSTPDFDREVAVPIGAGAKRLIVDCTELVYLSSIGLRSLLATAKQLRYQQGEMVFAGLRDAALEAFEIAGFSGIFKLFDSIDDALVDN